MGCMDWVDVVQNRARWRAFVDAVMNLRVPYSAENLLTSWGPVSFSGGSLLHGVTSTYRNPRKLLTLYVPNLVFILRFLLRSKKNLTNSQALLNNFKLDKNNFYYGGFSTLSNTQAGRPPPDVCHRLSIQYFRSYPSCMDAVFFSSPNNARRCDDRTEHIYHVNICFSWLHCPSRYAIAVQYQHWNVVTPYRQYC